MISTLTTLLVLGAACGSLFEEDIKNLGYPYEVHQVETADGFDLTLFRVQSRKWAAVRPGLQPVLMTHGLDEIAHVWIINEQDKALALVLADQGYDVWLLNNRGTAYSRTHKNHHILSHELWDYSFQDMGEHDIPAAIDYIHDATGGRKLVAVGHSQGATQVFAAISDPITSERVQSKLMGLVGMSPVPHVSDVPSKTRYIYTLVKSYVFMHGLVGLNYPVLSSTKENFVKSSIMTMCRYFGFVCEAILSVPGLSTEFNRAELIEKFFQILPGGASFRCYLHFEQLSRIESDKPVLRKYDFGSHEENHKRYGTPVPPDYDFGLIRVPVYIHSGAEDILTTPKSLEKFVWHMRGLGKEVESTIYPEWDHFSVLFSRDPSLVFGNVLKDIRRLEEREQSVPRLSFPVSDGLNK